MKAIRLFIVVMFFVQSLAIAAKTENWVVAVSDFSSRSRSNILQRDAIFFTEYVTYLLESNTRMTVKNRFEIGKILSDPTLSEISLLSEIGKRSGVDAVLTASIDKLLNGDYKFTCTVVSTKNNEYETFTFDYSEQDERSLKEQFQSFLKEILTILEDVIEGRSWIAPPNLKHLNIGFDVNGIIGENRKDVVNYRNPSIVTRHQLMSASFNFRFSNYVYGMLSGAMFSATDKVVTGDITADPVQPEYYTALESLFGYAPDGTSYFYRVMNEAGRNGTFLRKDAIAYYVGGGLGIRTWRFRLGGQFLIPTTKIYKKDKNSDLFPKALILANFDVYVLLSSYVGINFTFTNTAGVIDNNLSELYPEGIPSTLDLPETGIKRRVMQFITLRCGVEF